MDCSDGHTLCIGNGRADCYFVGQQLTAENGVSPSARRIDLFHYAGKIGDRIGCERGEVGTVYDIRNPVVRQARQDCDAARRAVSGNSIANDGSAEDFVF